MKLLNNPTEHIDWGNELIKDLSFIKNKRRYPLSKRTFTPLAFLVLVTLGTLRFAWPVMFVTSKVKNPLIETLLTCFIALMMVIMLVRQISVLRFKTIQTSYYLHDNIALLEKFLSSRGLAFTQHNEAPEVFMIISRNLNNNDNNERREVMVFVADDKQILVNSHFTGSKYIILPPSRNFKRMANELKAWLDSYISKADTRSVTVN